VEIKNGEMQWHSKDPNVVYEKAYLESVLLHIVKKIKKNDGVCQKLTS
jgi:hypothetical protein